MTSDVSSTRSATCSCLRTALDNRRVPLDNGSVPLDNGCVPLDNGRSAEAGGRHYIAGSARKPWPCVGGSIDDDVCACAARTSRCASIEPVGCIARSIATPALNSLHWQPRAVLKRDVVSILALLVSTRVMTSERRFDKSASRGRNKANKVSN